MNLQGRIVGPQPITDAYLLALAMHHRGKLATLDKGLLAWGSGQSVEVLLHTLLGINTQSDVENHPKVGASWEGYAVEEILKAFRPDEAYYWATHQGAEIDLVLFKSGRRIGVECKRADALKVTPSMRVALADLKLDRIHVVDRGEKTYSIAKNIEVIPLVTFLKAK